MSSNDFPNKCSHTYCMVRIAELSRRISNNIVVSEATAQVELAFMCTAEGVAKEPTEVFLTFICDRV